MGMTTREGTLGGVTEAVIEGKYLTAGPGTPGDHAVGGSRPAEAFPLRPA